MNTWEVFRKVDEMISEAEVYKRLTGKNKRYRINAVYSDLGIFDWWNEYLSVTQLKQMRDFLSFSMMHGYDGYVCFKVGAKYCAHGMWAFNRESEYGYSPEGACLYHSFRDGENYFDIRREDGKWLGDADDGQRKFTKKEAAELLAAGAAL